MKIRKAAEKDYVYFGECSCGFVTESDDSDNVVEALSKHHKREHGPGEDGIGGMEMMNVMNSKAGRKVRKELDTLIGANGEVYIIEEL